MKNQILWAVPKKKRILTFTFAKSEFTVKILKHLAINGISSARDTAENILKSEQQSKVVTKRQIFNKKISVFNKIRDRQKNGKTIPGFITKGFVIHIRNDPNNHAELYSLTLRGCILALGLGLTNEELRKCILFYSKYFHFFSYLQDIINLYSFDIVKKFYIKPIQELISNGRIDLFEDFTVTYLLISEKCCLNLSREIKKEKNLKQKMKSIEKKFMWTDMSYSDIVGLKIYDNSETDDVYDCKLTYRVSEEMGNTLINFSAFGI